LLFAGLRSHDMWYRDKFKNEIANDVRLGDVTRPWNVRVADSFRTFSSYACPSLQFNSATKDAIRKVKERAGLSKKFIEKFPSNYKSVAFHIRRGDKILEHEPYPADLYVKKLLDVIGGGTNRKKISHCFLLTDDYAVVDELSTSLKKRNIPCRLETLAPKERKGLHYTYPDYYPLMHHPYDDAIVYMAELSIAIDSSYFIGTFNSNLGTVLTLLRSCKPTTDFESDYETLFDTYGIDRGGNWFIV